MAAIICFLLPILLGTEIAFLTSEKEYMESLIVGEFLKGGLKNIELKGGVI